MCIRDSFAFAPCIKSRVLRDHPITSIQKWAREGGVPRAGVLDSCTMRSISNSAWAVAFALLAGGCTSPRTDTPSNTVQPKEQSMSTKKKITLAAPIKVDAATLRKLEQELVKQHGKQSLQRIRSGLKQVVSRWRRSDGSVEELSAFVKQHFLSDQEQLLQRAIYFVRELERGRMLRLLERPSLVHDS